MLLLVIAFYSLMYPGLGVLGIPVLFYVSAIGLMGVLAVNRYYICTNSSFWFILIGALSFILSDCIIGYTKFVDPLPFAHTHLLCCSIVWRSI